MADTQGDLRQFRDPFGLVWRMLTSRDKSAYWALTQLVATACLTPVDLLLRPLESRLSRGPVPCEHPLVLIVGAPRSGSTLVYQVLARCLDVTYFINLSSLFPRSPLAASQVTGALRCRPRADFHSFYGTTTGLSAPNDAFHVWNRWLGTNRYRPTASISEGEAEDLRRFLAVWMSRAGKPLLNKNNRNTACIPLLASALESAHFVVVSRDPVYVVQSLLLGRQSVQGERRVGWGLESGDLNTGADWESVVDEVCRQVERIERALDEARRQVPGERIIDVAYEDFCADPEAAIQENCRRIPRLKRSETDPSELQALRPSKMIRPPEHEFSRIQKRFS